MSTRTKGVRMTDESFTSPTGPTDVVRVELLSAKGHLRAARFLAQTQGDPAPALARITLALDAVQDALDHRAEQS